MKTNKCFSISREQIWTCIYYKNFAVYLKFKFKWASCIFSGKPTSVSQYAFFCVFLIYMYMYISVYIDIHLKIDRYSCLPHRLYLSVFPPSTQYAHSPPAFVCTAVVIHIYLPPLFTLPHPFPYYISPSSVLKKLLFFTP